MWNGKNKILLLPKMLKNKIGNYLMWIYKITNIQNNKVYIGQTIRPIEQRFHRHLNDALNNILDTHLARAIRKYGKDSFIIEEIDNAQTQDELNQKEQYWIRYYNSVKDGYNETDAISKCGGNTYQSKTKEEMEVIKDKIRQTKIGANNPMARKIKRTNIITNEEYRNSELAEKVKLLKSKYGDARRTVITQINDLTKEDKEIEFVEPEKCVVIMTEGGLIKRIPSTSFRVQKRNGKGVKT